MLSSKDEHSCLELFVRVRALVLSAMALTILGSLQLVSPAFADGSWQFTPSPFDPTGTLASVSCPTIVFCVAVGGGEIQNSQTVSPLIEEYNGSQWSDTLSGIESQDATLFGISCSSIDFCMAVGAHGSESTLFSESFNGSTWAVVSTANGKVIPELTEVSCTSSSFCIGAGGSSGTVAIYSGTSWSEMTLSSIPSVSDVSCASAEYCMAIDDVGYSNMQNRQVASVYDGTTWKTIVSPDIPQGEAWASLTNVSCISPTYCIGVGDAGVSYLDSTFFSEKYDGVSWSTISNLSNNGSDVQVLGLDCSTITYCEAIGVTSSPPPGPQYNSVIESYNGSQWSQIPNPQEPIGNNLGIITDAGILQHGIGYYTLGISCPQGIYCVAVGYTNLQVSPTSTSTLVLPLIMTDKKFVAMAPSSGGSGYWLASSNGGIFDFGSAASLGSASNEPLNAPIVSMAATPDGQGYWEVAADGGIFSFGNATFYGSMGDKPLNAPIVSMAATPDGQGYWEIAADGGIFSFGNATFYGSMGDKPLNAPIVSMAATPDGQGYWEIAADGGVFNYGDAGFYGSAT